MLVLAAALTGLHAQQLRLGITLTNNANLVLQWNSTPGTDYQLQRSQTNRLPVNASEWVALPTLRASNAVTVVTELIGPGFTQRYYRLLQFTNSVSTNPTSLTVSAVDAAPEAGGGPSSVLRVFTGGTQTVSSVTFFDNGLLLGSAELGLGNFWSFNLPGDNRTPRLRRISARVTTEDGIVTNTPVTAFLQADPARFVPVKADGARAFGQFVSADAAGNLGPFLFFPEGLGDAATTTGAYFELLLGGLLRTNAGVNEIEFSAGKFYRGQKDTAPLVAIAGTRRINIDAATAPAVTAALGLPAGTAMSLLWGNIPVSWLDGALSGAGWGGLKVRPPIGDFLLPIGQECSRVSFDAKSGDPTLIVCYHGEWAPFPDGPLFRIPRGEPLKIYLSLSGKISASATVEAVFASGATVRGSVSWREPNFEVRLQGRNIVIPALSSLKRALPTTPEQCIPAGSSTAELDAAAKCLTSFRDTYRSLALGGLAEANTTNSVALAPLAEPADSVGTALNAWAARLASWTADRAGQRLDDQTAGDLQKVVANAAKTGEAAQDLSTALKLLRDVLVLQKFRDAAIGTGAAGSALRAQLQDVQTRLFAAVERIADAAETFEPSAEFSDIVALLGDTTTQTAASSPVAAAQTSPRPLDASSELQTLTALLHSKFGIQFDRQVRDAAANTGFSAKSAGELLALLDNLVLYYRFLELRGFTAPAGKPTAQDLLQAAQNIRPQFATQSDGAASAANAPADYLKLRDVLADRARFFALNDRLGLTLASDQGGFFILTPGLIQNFIERFNALPFSDKPRACRQDLEFISTIAEHTSDTGSHVALGEAQALVENCNVIIANALAASSAANRCDDLAQALVKAGLTIARPALAAEGSAFPDITGRYESVENGTESYVTVQLSQGGRYLKGGMQLQVESQNGQSASYTTWKLDGLFLSQTATPGTMNLACRAINVASGATQFLKGTARRDNASGITTLTLGTLQFTQTAQGGLFSDAILEAFEPGQRGLVKATQQTPMHSRVIARTSTDAANLRLTLDRYFSSSASRSDELAAVTELNGKLQRIDRRLATGQRPIGASLIRRLLSTPPPKTVAKSKVTGNSTDFGNQTLLYWDLLLAVTLREHLDLSAQLGLTAAQLQELQAAIGQSAFHYEMVIVQNSATLGDAFLSFGAGELSVTVRKFSPTGQLLDTFHLIGGLASYSPALSPIPASCTLTTSTNKFDSPFSFSQADFAGPFEFGFFSANAAATTVLSDSVLNVLGTVKGLAGIDPSVNTWAVGYFEVDGSGRFPAMTFVTLPQDGFAVNQCVNVGVGVDVGGGALLQAQATEPDSLLFNPGQFVPFDTTTAHAELQGGVYFEINGATLTDCGLQFLREFVAENHDLFVGTKSKISVEGHTDAAGHGAFNQQLSQARADSVKQALIGLLGPSLRNSITATGHGETEHDAVLHIGPEDPAPNDALFRRADIIVGGVVKASLGAPITPQQ